MLNYLVYFVSSLTMRMQASTGQLAQTHLLRTVRRNIARVKTIITEKAGK